MGTQTVPIERLRLGMFVHELGESWLHSPFWRRRFLLQSDDDLNRLREAGIDHVVIDLDRGLPPLAPTAAGASSVAVDELRETAAYDFDPLETTSTTFADERHRAQQVITRSKIILRGVFDGARLGGIVGTDDVRTVVDEVASSISRNHHALIGIVRLKTKDEYTYLHSVAVCGLMISLARRLGVPGDVERRLGMAGLLHDIGKMGVPTPILNKPGKLTEDEFRIVRLHPERGSAILIQAEGLPDEVMDVCRHHHEKIDGTGYPFGLRGDQISLAARMGAICDVYDALTSNRIYKSAWTPVDAVTRMWSWDGQFDRDLLFAFFQATGIFPTGLAVRLDSGRSAIVLPNGRRASRTRVRVFLDRIGDVDAPADEVVGETDSTDSIAAWLDPEAMCAHDWPAAQRHLLRETGTVDFETLRSCWHGPRPTGLSGERPSDGRQSVRAWAPMQARR